MDTFPSFPDFLQVPICFLFLQFGHWRNVKLVDLNNIQSVGFDFFPPLFGIILSGFILVMHEFVLFSPLHSLVSLALPHRDVHIEGHLCCF